MTQEFRVIGLTGPSGAGKSTIAALFSGDGIPVIDADAVYHDLLIPPSACLNALADEFSAAILTPQGTLDRSALAALVFEDSDAGRARKARLNTITHRFVIKETNRLIADYRASGMRAVVIDAPLLIEAGMHRDCDFNVCVLAPEEVRLRRLMARDKKDQAAILARIHAQPDDEFYRQNTDAVIVNGADDGDTDSLKAQFTNVLRRAGVSI